ncbi:MAG: L-seryl-tRNA(Sec) selenium transferase [Planctomycetota bacterium]|nr:L-seryl-tRNA(Sec) selenium transferase [Planctomycetota bacterium]
MSESTELPPLPKPVPPEGAGDVPTLLRSLPPVNEVVQDLSEADLAAASRDEWVEEVRQALSELRAKILGGQIGPIVVEKSAQPDALKKTALKRIQRRRDPGCVRIVNGTGVVLHTNLGRAAMPQAAVDALTDHGRGYALLAADRTTGERAPRERHVERLLQRLTGAEAATVVNNNAAATMVALGALATGREVIVARGQLVEIGGAYRIPEVMTQSGATLREVGTTNRVHLRDYENAINENTACIMRVHTSNYRVEGFSGEVSLDDMVALARAYKIPVVDDLGSGAVVSLSAHGVPGDEPLISSSIESGADLITASGDKLIGGPQMGILVGTRECVARVRAHPLYRAIRCDKLTLIAMEATLRLLLHPETLGETHPTFAMLTATREHVLAKAAETAARLKDTKAAHGGHVTISVEEVGDAVGAGSLPTVELPGAAVVVTSHEIEGGELARRLRAGNPPVFTTVKDGRVEIHSRTLRPGDNEDVARALDDAFEQNAS